MMNAEKHEFEARIKALCAALSGQDPSFGTALIAGRINQYYLTGTMQDGLLVLKPDGGAFYFIRKSIDRARMESPLDIVYPMASYRDITNFLAPEFGHTYIDADVATVSMLERWKKYFRMDSIRPLDRIILDQRAVKSPYELDLMTRSGLLHARLLNEIVPALLREGMSEAEFHGRLFDEMMRLGYHGVSRFSMFQAEVVAGQFGFGENSVYPTSFDGPGGMKGMGAAAPSAGDPERKLKKGDLVFVDIGFGVGGYHSDKTQVYSFGAPPAPELVTLHRACIDVQKRCADSLVEGAIPSEIYTGVMGSLPDCLRGGGFMGCGQSVNFLGHGIGLHINEMPVIARGFDEPLRENMVLALEPKCGIPGVGTVGVEDSYVVKKGHSACLTGGGIDIITV